MELEHWGGLRRSTTYEAPCLSKLFRKYGLIIETETTYVMKWVRFHHVFFGTVLHHVPKHFPHLLAVLARWTAARTLSTNTRSLVEQHGSGQFEGKRMLTVSCSLFLTSLTSDFVFKFPVPGFSSRTSTLPLDSPWISAATCLISHKRGELCDSAGALVIAIFSRLFDTCYSCCIAFAHFLLDHKPLRPHVMVDVIVRSSLLRHLLYCVVILIFLSCANNQRNWHDDISWAYLIRFCRHGFGHWSCIGFWQG